MTLFNDELVDGPSAEGMVVIFEHLLAVEVVHVDELGGFEDEGGHWAGRNRASNRLRNAEIPIIALTADAFPETKKKVMESGMNDFVTKPLEQTDLYNKIKLHALKPVHV